jgi:hypothetical protein
VEGHIFFKEPKHEYAIFGLDSVWIRQNARIESGDVGAQGECESCLVNQFEVAVDGAWVADGTIIKGDSVLLANRASVWDVQCNDYVDSGEIRGEISEPLGLPVWEGLNNLFPSDFTPSNKKKDDISVGSHGTRTISSGRYRDISIGSHAKLYLEPGLYHVRKLELGSHSSLICKGELEIRIAENIVAGSAKASYLGSSAVSGFSPKDVKVYVKGGGDEVVAAAFGQGHVIRANIFAKNGSLTTGEGCVLEGCFIAEDIVIGQKSIVNCDCDF